jgi:hypothetical protein
MLHAQVEDSKPVAGIITAETNIDSFRIFKLRLPSKAAFFMPELLFALLLKNIKLIGLALAGISAGAWKWFKRKTEPPTVKTLEGEEKIS